MEYLHAQQPPIIHRDLKSHNVLKSFDGKYKICDFGLVAINSTQAGTPAYMAPELFQNKFFNKSVDVYSFGVLMWEIYSGSIPFKMKSIDEIRTSVIAGERLRIPDYNCPSRIASLITQCWNQNADSRPSFTTVVDELLAISDTIPQYNNVMYS